MSGPENAMGNYCKMTAIYETLETCWRLRGVNRKETWEQLRETMQTFLSENDVATTSFGHFGIVVSSIDQALDAWAACAGEQPTLMRRDWVQSFNVHVARFAQDETEVEFLEPEGKSFFEDHLNSQGEGLQHVAFQVDDIEAALQGLANNEINLVDSKPRQGSHGKIAFARPQTFEPLYLEVYQVL